MDILQIACENEDIASWILVLLILLAGINFPLSLDIILISAGALGSTCLLEQTYSLFFIVFIASWISAWEAYWLGRLLGPKLYDFRWFSHILSLKRIERLHHYYEKFGFLTFMVGRFIPGGVRNALFMTSGLGKMPFYKFILRDLPACLLSCGFLYYLGYLFGMNYPVIVTYFKRYNLVVIIAIFLSIAVFLLMRWIRAKKFSKDHPTEKRDI